MSENDGIHIEYVDEQELKREFRRFMSDPETREKAANYLYESLVDETILGIAYEVHHANKTGSGAAVEGEPEDSKPYTIVDQPDTDVFGSSNTKKAIDCHCPNCNRIVAASRFAPHLEKCMGKNASASSVRSSSASLAWPECIRLHIFRYGKKLLTHRKQTYREHT